MARAGINKALVQLARDALLARGDHPSIEAVRVELGNTGSKSTILRYLQELAQEEPQPPAIRLDEELQTLINNLAQRLAASAQASVAADRARLQRQQVAYEQQRAIEQARFDQLQSAHLALSRERQEAQLRENQLNQQAQQREGERQRLLAAEQLGQCLLEERARRIQSLEDKYQQAREALDHYRQQHLAQRDQEQQRHGQQVQQLQLDIRRLQEQLMARQEELTQVYRDLERLSREQQLRLLEIREQEQALKRNEAVITQLQAAVQQAEEYAQQRLTEFAVVQEKARRYLTHRREDRRALRLQTKLIADLRALLTALHQQPSTNPTRP